MKFEITTLPLPQSSLGSLRPNALPVTVLFEEKSSKPFRMLVAPMCLAQALVVALGESIAK
jgi:hypothetical protein